MLARALALLVVLLAPASVAQGQPLGPALTLSVEAPDRLILPEVENAPVKVTVTAACSRLLVAALVLLRRRA